MPDVIWYQPWDPEKSLFTHPTFSELIPEIFGSGLPLSFCVCVRYPGRRLDNLGDESQWVRRIMILYFMGPNEVHYLMLDQNLILEHPSHIYLKPNSRLIMFYHPVDTFSAEHQTVCVAFIALSIR